MTYFEVFNEIYPENRYKDTIFYLENHDCINSNDDIWEFSRISFEEYNERFDTNFQTAEEIIEADPEYCFAWVDMLNDFLNKDLVELFFFRDECTLKYSDKKREWVLKTKKGIVSAPNLCKVR